MALPALRRPCRIKSATALLPHAIQTIEHTTHSHQHAIAEQKRLIRAYEQVAHAITRMMCAYEQVMRMVTRMMRAYEQVMRVITRMMRAFEQVTHTITRMAHACEQMARRTTRVTRAYEQMTYLITQMAFAMTQAACMIRLMKHAINKVGRGIEPMPRIVAQIAPAIAGMTRMSPRKRWLITSVLCYSIRMKRPGRWLFNFAAAVSLVFSIVVIGLWSISSRHPFGVRYHRSPTPELYALVHPGIAWELVSANGLISFKCIDERDPRFGKHPPILQWVNADNFYLSRDAIPLLRDRLFPAFTVAGSFNRPDLKLVSGWWVLVSIPDWFAIAIGAVLPIVWIFHKQRRRAKAMNGLCVVCGYDLRATPDRCPECGTIPSTAKGEIRLRKH